MSWCPYCEHGEAEHNRDGRGSRRRCQASRARCSTCERARYAIRRLRAWGHQGLDVWAVEDEQGRQVWPRPGQAETFGACQRWLDRPAPRA